MELPTETMVTLGASLGDVVRTATHAASASADLSAALRGLRRVKFTDLRAGDSFAVDAGKWRAPVLYVDHVYAAGERPNTNPGDLRCINEMFDLVRISRPDREDAHYLTGYTNRRAKRQRGKLRRRARFAAQEATA